MGLSKHANEQVQERLKELFGAYMSGANAYDDSVEYNHWMAMFAMYLKKYHPDIESYFDVHVAILWFEE